MRWISRLYDRERKAFGSESHRSKGRYSMPGTVGTLAATTEIYAIAECRTDHIARARNQAREPLDP